MRPTDGTPMKLKSSCCEKYLTKAKACRRCPLMAVLTSKKRRKTLERVKKQLEKAA